MNAFVLSGGGNLGSIQAGMLEGLLAAGVRPDLLVGTSIGAANAAFLAADPSPEGARSLSAVWRSVRSRDVFPLSPLTTLRALRGKGALFDTGAWRNFLEHNLPYRTFEEVKVPLRIVSTSFETGWSVTLESGSVVDAVLASTALPGLFPPHEIDGELYLDGGLVDHVPLSAALDGGATTIYVLSVGFPCPPPRDRRSPRSVLLHSLGILLSQRTRLDEIDVPQHHPRVKIVRIPPVCTQMGLRDFSRSDELIRRARTKTQQFLVGDPCPTCDHRMVLNERLLPKEA